MPPPPSEFIGSWLLISYTKTAGDGSRTFPYGETPLGLLMYTPDGFVSAHISSSNRAPWQCQRLEEGTADEMTAAMSSFRSYCGTARVILGQKIVEHCITICSFPNRVGRTLRRSYAFSDDGGTLTLEPDGSEAGSTGDAEALVWRRAVAAAEERV